MNYLFAKHYNGSFIVRIEDTDTARNVTGAIESQFDNLQWLGIIPDESLFNPVEGFGPYQQSEKFPHYRELADTLIEQGKAYKCFCTPEELEADFARQEAEGVPSPKYNLKCYGLTEEQVQANIAAGKPYSVRFHVLPNKTYVLNDIVRGEVTFNSNDFGDFIIVKSNHIGTYNFAVVIDDHEMKITHVIRGEEHISNTPRQLMLYEAFGWEVPQFAHLTLIVDDTRKKLSKRSGNALFFIEQYRKQGYLPEAIFNYIALLGWSPKGEKEILSKEELIEQFDPQRFSKSPSTFDMVKMTWINSVYIKKMSDEAYLEFVKQFIDPKRFKLKDIDPELLEKILLLFKTEIMYGEQINDHLDIFFNDIELSNATMTELSQLDESFAQVIETFTQHLNEIPDEEWNEQTIQGVIKSTGKELEVKGRNLFMPIRIFTSKSQHGPSLASVIFYLGKDKVNKNIQSVKDLY